MSEPERIPCYTFHGGAAMVTFQVPSLRTHGYTVKELSYNPSLRTFKLTMVQKEPPNALRAP